MLTFQAIGVRIAYRSMRLSNGSIKHGVPEWPCCKPEPTSEGGGMKNKIHLPGEFIFLVEEVHP